MNNYPAPKPGIEPVISLSTRVSPEIMAMLDGAVARIGCTQRSAVEHAIRATYGPREGQEADIRPELSAAAELIAKAHDAVLEAWDKAGGV